MKLIKPTLFCLFTSLVSTTNLLAKGAGTSGGLTLIEPYGARPASLGEAFTAAENDISAFGYNPASLQTLDSGNASFMYQKGLAEDAYGQFMFGSPMKNGSLGVSLGYYNGGSIDLYDGTTERTVTAQKDLSMAVGYAASLGNMSFGLTGKYLSSQLIESEKATAYAADFGMQMPVGSRLRVGAAIQNLGTKLTFVSEGDNLPRIARGGLAMQVMPGKYSTTLFLDAPYYMNEGEIRPGAGLEVKVGPMAIRGGYKGGNGLEEFSLGAGFLLGRSSLDYSFGMVQDLQAQHRVSMNLKFGGVGSATPPQIVRRQTEQMNDRTSEEERTRDERVSRIKFMEGQTLGEMDKKEKIGSRRVYVVKPGDTLSKIATKMYGDAREWKRIYLANRRLLEGSKNVEVGQKIVLP